MKRVTVILFALLNFGLLKSQEVGKFSVYFSLNNCEPSEQVKNIVADLEENDKVSITVIGYTDFIGSTDYNAKLAECRAKKIANELKAQLGDHLDDIDIKGEGELFSEVQTPDGVPKHRRVDVQYSITRAIEEVEFEVKQVTEVQVPKEELIEIDTAKGKNIVLDGLSFIPGRHYPVPSSGPVLEKLLRTMKANPQLEIEIQGFICCDYTVEDGYDNDTGEQKLSENRAKFVYDYLKTGGISATRMSYKGYGSTRPKIFPEKTPEDEQANRRVEIEILKF